MGLPKRLTEMQKRFAELLVFGGPDGPLTKAEAAKQALISKTKDRNIILHCDSCDKYGMSGNMIFDGDFYCDLCHLKDHLEDLEKLVKDLDNQFLDDLRRMVYR